MPQEKRKEDGRENEREDGQRDENQIKEEHVSECESEYNDALLESESVPLVRIGQSSSDKSERTSQRYYEESNMQFTSKEALLRERSVRKTIIPSSECAQGSEETLEAVGEVGDQIPLLVLTKNLSDSNFDSIFLVESRLDSSIRCPISPGQPQCRICFEPGGDDLIAPCQCKGTQKYVHRSCLDHWRTAKEGFAFANCTECRACFRLRENIPPDRWWRKLKFQIYVARDHVIIFLLVQLVVAALGVLVYTIYGDEIKYDFGYSEQPYGFVTTVVLLLVVVGMLYGFFVAVICGQRINDRHYHILQKQALTLEFVVEDLEKVGEAQKLDIQPCHMKELKSLGLL